MLTVSSLYEQYVEYNRDGRGFPRRSWVLKC
nr:MAG TPA: hypothetical protein [Caudoviricetes sp.]